MYQNVIDLSEVLAQRGPTPRREPCRKPADDSEYDPCDDPRGRSGGYRDFTITVRKKDDEGWQALAAAHGRARGKLNALLPAPRYLHDQYERRGGNIELLGDYVSPNNLAVERATQAYRRACAAILEYPHPKQRHVVCLIRCAAELMGLPDPMFSHAECGQPENPNDFIVQRLVRAVQRAEFPALARP